MESKTDYLRNLARQLKLTGIGADLDTLLINAQQKQISYLDLAISVLLNAEIELSESAESKKETPKKPGFPSNNLDSWQDNQQKGISKQQLSQLRECFWMEQNFNLVLMGPSGTGKTFIAAGLCHDALKKGYKACFRTMEQLNYLLKMKEFTKSAAREYQ